MFSRLVLLALPLGASAQEPAPPTGIGSVGIGAAVIDSPYAGEGSRVRPFPWVTYEGERFFFRGISGGAHLYRAGGFTIDALVSARLQGFDIDDLGRAELLANGLDADRLSDRDDGLDAGFRASYGSTWGTIAFEAVHDVTDASGGYELSLDYRYTWRFERTALTAEAGASWLSSDLAGYYFGTLEEEVARGVTAYAPGSAVVPNVGLTVTHAIGSSRWQFVGSAQYQFLPSELADSPLLERDRDGFGRVMLGLSRRF